MKAWFPILAALVISAATAAPPDATDASSGAGIQRCEATDGTAVYTDKGCAPFDAHPTPMPGELLTRIAMADTSSFSARELSPAVYRDASEPMPEPALGRRPAADGCARSPRQLSVDLIGSFAMHDVNRVAESYHWAGMSQRQAMPVMQQLERLARQPLDDARFLAAWIGPGNLTPQAIPADAGLMQLVFAGDSMRVIDFEVRKYSGCYFISF